MSDLDNMRHIHTKSEIPKFFGQLLLSQAKDLLIDNMSHYQIASKPGHRSSEHLYVLKNILSMIQKKKKAVRMSLWDLKKFFDSENLIDCMSEMYKSNVKGKIYRLLYKMNQNIRISVKTPVG